MESKIGSEIQNKWGKDELMMNYKDICCIYGRDLDIVQLSYWDTNNTEQLWLNDTIIHYWLIRLQETYCNDPSILLIFDPIVVSYMIHQLDITDVEECQNVWKSYSGFQHVQRMIVPINDTMISSTPSSNHYHHHHQYPSSLGTHWSLLVLDIEPQMNIDNENENVDLTWILHGYHMDSITSNSGNIHCAQAVANQFQRLMHHRMLSTVDSNHTKNNNDHPNRNTTTTTATMKSSVANAVPITEVCVPQQTNGYDCGIHLLLNAETVIQETYRADTTAMSHPCFTDQAFFHQQQRHRLSASDFSMSERRMIAQDIIEQQSSIVSGSNINR